MSLEDDRRDHVLRTCCVPGTVLDIFLHYLSYFSQPFEVGSIGKSGIKEAETDFREVKS